MSKFLEELKNAADNGEFNSETAKKIIEIDKLADNPKGLYLSEEEMRKAKELRPVQVVSEDEVSELNSEYEKKMAEIKEVDAVNNQLAVLIEIEDLVRSSIFDMMVHITSIEDNLKEKLDTKPYTELKEKILKIRSIYEQLFIN